MTAQAILYELLHCGIEPELTPNGNGIVFPAGRLNDAQRAAIRAHKDELVIAIKESARLTSEVLAAAMRACDHWQDGPEAREAMRQDVLNTPPELRQDLLEHFKKAYPAGETDGQHD